MVNNNISGIYEEYFELIDNYFGSIRHYLGDDLESHIDLGEMISRYPLISDLILDSIIDLDSDIENFWVNHAKALIEEVSEDDKLKCLYSGKLSPRVLESFVKRSALYLDTIIIPDPIFNLALFQRKVNNPNKEYLRQLVMNVFNVWKLKDLILSNTDQKILIILPVSLDIINEESREKLITNGFQKSLDYINNLTERDFKEMEEALDYFNRIDDLEKVYSNFKNKSILPETINTLDRAIPIFESLTNNRFNIGIKENSKGWHILTYFRGQFLRVQEHLYFCEKIKCEPIYDYELPWFFTNYELGGSNIDSAIINSLQKERFEWISEVPLKAIKVLRENNELDYMREVLRRGITSIKSRNDKNLLAVSEQIEKNIRDAFKRQNDELKKLNTKVNKITSREMPIATSGFITGFIPYLGNVVSIFTFGRDMKNLYKEKEGLLAKIESKESNIVNLLMNNYEKK